MTITLSVNNPINDTEETFPISTESFFNKYWLRFAEELDLEWIPIFNSGIFIEYDDFPYVLDEIIKLEKFVIGNEEIVVEDKEYLLSRLQNMKVLMQEYFEKSPDVVFYIG